MLARQSGSWRGGRGWRLQLQLAVAAALALQVVQQQQQQLQQPPLPLPLPPLAVLLGQPLALLRRALSSLLALVVHQQWAPLLLPQPRAAAAVAAVTPV